MRPLTTLESLREGTLKRYLSQYVLMHLTPTGHEKSIMDAVGSLRALLADTRLHNYDRQDQGQAAKVRIPTTVVAPRGERRTTASLYRPETKAGDPRFWVDDFKRDLDPDGVFVVAVYGEELLIVVLSGWGLEEFSPAALAALEDLPGGMIWLEKSYELSIKIGDVKEAKDIAAKLVDIALKAGDNQSAEKWTQAANAK